MPITLAAALESLFRGRFDGGSGSTEYGMAGAYLNPANPVSPYEWGSNGGPLAWKYTGEGGAARDLAVFKEGGPGNKGYNSLGDYGAIPADTIPGFETGVPGARGPAVNNPRGSWVDVAIEKSGNLISFSLNGVVIDTYDNSSNFYSVGTILLGASDPFNSVNGGNGVVLDDIVVTVVPEPGALALVGLAGLTMLRRARRA